MDKHDKSKELEVQEETQERDAETTDKTEEEQIDSELQEANSIEQEEEHLDINLITSIETELKSYLPELTSQTSTSKKLTEQQIGIIIAKINGWTKNREQLRDHIKQLLAEETTIQKAVSHKLHDENDIMHEKEVETKLREVMWGSEFKKYLQYEPDGITIAPMEHKHFKDIQALETEIEEAKKNITECSLEDNISKLLTFELNKVYFLILKELQLFKHIETILKNTMVDIEAGKTDFTSIQTNISKTTEHIEHLIIEEIRILDAVPSGFIELKKEDLLDEEHLQHIEELEKTSNF